MFRDFYLRWPPINFSIWAHVSPNKHSSTVVYVKSDIVSVPYSLYTVS